jgi:hypothetical protein
MDLVERKFSDRPFEAPLLEQVPVSYHVPFELDEAQFERLRQADPVWTAIGGAVLASGAGKLLEALSDWRKPSFSWFVVGVTIAVSVAGGLVVLWGTAFPKRRRALLREIEAHFETNKAKKGLLKP